jgi:hypothetical protein
MPTIDSHNGGPLAEVGPNARWWRKAEVAALDCELLCPHLREAPLLICFGPAVHAIWIADQKQL